MNFAPQFIFSLGPCYCVSLQCFKNGNVEIRHAVFVHPKAQNTQTKELLQRTPSTLLLPNY